MCALLKPGLANRRDGVSSLPCAAEEMVCGRVFDGTDKGSVSALRLAKLLGVSWPTTYFMLQHMRQTMHDRDSVYSAVGADHRSG
jgi:hypothetical protein